MSGKTNRPPGELGLTRRFYENNPARKKTENNSEITTDTKTPDPKQG